MEVLNNSNSGTVSLPMSASAGGSGTSSTNLRRRTLQMAVCYLLTECGFHAAEREVLETLCEMLQAFLMEVGESSKGLCELAGRTCPILSDVILALGNMGVTNFMDGSLEKHAWRPGVRTIASPASATAPRQFPTLQAGSKMPHPPHVPSHLPPLPDAHAYIRTPTHKQPVTEYEAIREKAAQQKRDVERALTKFVAKTSEQQSLFASSENNTMFPLIAPKYNGPSYLAALLPRDQVFDPEDLEPLLGPRNATGANKSGDGATESADDGNDEGNANEDNQQVTTTTATNKSTELAETIDNPYLRPVKMPRKLK